MMMVMMMVMKMMMMMICMTISVISDEGMMMVNHGYFMLT
jgi:hypothetical protein